MARIETYVFHGIQPYTVAITCAASLPEAARAVHVPVSKCSPWEESADWNKPFRYRVVSRGDVIIEGE